MNTQEFLNVIQETTLTEKEVNEQPSLIDIRNKENKIIKILDNYIYLGLSHKAKKVFEENKNYILNTFEKTFFEFKINWKAGDLYSAKKDLEKIIRYLEFSNENSNSKLIKISKISEWIDVIDDGNIFETFIHHYILIAIIILKTRLGFKNNKQSLNSIGVVILNCDDVLAIAMCSELLSTHNLKDESERCIKYWKRKRNVSDLAYDTKNSFFKNYFEENRKVSNVNKVQEAKKEKKKEINLKLKKNKFEIEKINLEIEDQKRTYPLNVDEISIDFINGLIGSGFLDEAENLIKRLEEKGELNRAQDDEFQFQISRMRKKLEES